MCICAARAYSRTTMYVYYIVYPATDTGIERQVNVKACTSVWWDTYGGETRARQRYGLRRMAIRRSRIELHRRGESPTPTTRIVRCTLCCAVLCCVPVRVGSWIFQVVYN